MMMEASADDDATVNLCCVVQSSAIPQGRFVRTSLPIRTAGWRRGNVFGDGEAFGVSWRGRAGEWIGCFGRELDQV